MQALSFRPARRDDLVRLVAMLADDTLGAQRERNESPLPLGYGQALEAIDRDPNNELVVACGKDGIVGMLQLTFIPGLTYQGGWRALVESVRIGKDHRGQGYGRQLFQWAIDRAREKGCRMVQLTSDKTRTDALRFYASLGFSATHEGLKLHL